MTAELICGASSDAAVTREVAGGTSVSRHEIFKIRLPHDSSSATDGEKLFAFIDNFQQWADYAHFHGMTEAISGDGDAKIWADSYYEQSENAGGGVYTIQLHAVYDRIYA